MVHLAASYYFPRPWYQELAVGLYLDQHVSAETRKYYSSFVDFSGRGFPDVAAHSVSPESVLSNTKKNESRLTRLQLSCIPGRRTYSKWRHFCSRTRDC
jgi:hypothetical protein